MASIHSRDDLIEALDACWKLLYEKTQPPDKRNYGAEAPELVELMKNHKCLAELDESGVAGYCGIGLGNMGGHAVGCDDDLIGFNGPPPFDMMKPNPPPAPPKKG